VDELYFGIARNIGTVAQATFVGGMEQVGAGAGCVYSENTSTGPTDFVSLGTGTGCNAWTVTSNGPGVISAVGTNDHRLTYTNMPAGNYRIILQSMFRNTLAGTCFFRLSDGTNSFQPQAVASSVSDGTVPLLSFDVSYNTPGTRTFTIQAADNSSTACIISSTNGIGLSWKIYRFPTREEQVLRHDQVAWRVDANIGGANPSLGLGNVSSYTEITNGSLDLVNNSGAGVIPAQIPCSGTNPPTGLTCSAGNESVGVSFNLPAAGDVLACVSFSHEIQAGSGSVAAWFQVVETPNNAQTILQEGGARIQSYHNMNGYIGFPHKVCGTLRFSSAGQKTLRLMYEQTSSGSPNASVIVADRNTSFGQRDIHWEVYPLNTYQPAPLLIGSVISGSSGIERVERAFTLSNCTSSPCALTSQSGGVSSVTRSGTGAYNINFSPPFSAQPTCTANCTVVGTIEAFADVIIPGTGSVSNVTCRRRDNGAVADAAFAVTCIGPR
jgi:hypothetical protein